MLLALTEIHMALSDLRDDPIVLAAIVEAITRRDGSKKRP
jgi:hypothetical protein